MIAEELSVQAGEDAKDSQSNSWANVAKKRPSCSPITVPESPAKASARAKAEAASSTNLSLKYSSDNEDFLNASTNEEPTFQETSPSPFEDPRQKTDPASTTGTLSSVTSYSPYDGNLRFHPGGNKRRKYRKYKKRRSRYNLAHGKRKLSFQSSQLAPHTISMVPYFHVPHSGAFHAPAIPMTSYQLPAMPMNYLPQAQCHKCMVPVNGDALRCPCSFTYCCGCAVSRLIANIDEPTRNRRNDHGETISVWCEVCNGSFAIGEAFSYRKAGYSILKRILSGIRAHALAVPCATPNVGNVSTVVLTHRPCLEDGCYTCTETRITARYDYFGQ